jgi:hypothetical protein
MVTSPEQLQARALNRTPISRGYSRGRPVAWWGFVVLVVLYRIKHELEPGTQMK